MPSLRELVLTERVRYPTARVFILHDGRQWDVTRYVANESGAITLTETFGQPIGGGAIKFAGSLPFVPLQKDIVEIHLGYNGLVRPAFTGLISDPQRQQYPKGYVCQVRNILYLADFPVQTGTAATWVDVDGNLITEQADGIVLLGPGGTPNNVPATEAIVRLLRDWSGIPEERIHIPELEIAPGEPWILGQLSPVAWTGVSPLQAALEIVSPLGYWLYADAAGHVRAISMGGGPADTADFVIEEGVNVLSDRPFSVTGSIDTFYNRVVVTGGNTFIVGEAAFPVRDAWQVDSPLLPGGRYREMGYSNRFIEFVNAVDGGAASATEVAKRLIREWSRTPFVVGGGSIKGNPYLSVGQTVGAIMPRLGLTEQQNFFIYSISTTFGAGVFEQSITLDGGTGEEGYTTIPPPTAAFTYQAHREFLEEGDRIELFFDGEASTSFGGAVIDWDWTATAPASPTTGTGRYWTILVPQGTASVTVTLQVTDTTGKNSEIYSQVINLGDTREVSPTSRILNFAAGNAWYATDDGGRAWQKATGSPTTVVPPISAGGDVIAPQDAVDASGLIANGGDIIRASTDALRTAPTNRGELPATPNFLWQHEVDPMIMYAAVADSLYRSQDAGVTWTLQGKPPVPTDEADQTMRWVTASRDNSQVVDVLIGRYMWTSWDGGITWPEVAPLTGPEGSIGVAYASGFDRHWVAFSNIVDASSPLRASEGDIAAFPIVDPPVTNLVALTMMVDQPLLYCIDMQGRIWRVDADSGNNATHVATMPD